MFGRDVRRRPVELSGAREARSVLPVSSCPVPTWTTTQHLCICAYLHSCICIYFICVFVKLRICCKINGQARRPAKQPYRTAPRSWRSDRLENCDFAGFWEPIGQPSKHLKGFLGPPSVTKIFTSSRGSVETFFIFDVVLLHLSSIIVSKMINRLRCKLFILGLFCSRFWSFWPNGGDG